MAGYDERFREHAVHGVLHDLQTLLDALRTETPGGLDQVERLRTAARHIASLIQQSDPYLISFRTLDALEAQLTSMAGVIATYGAQETEDLSPLTQANLHIEEALSLSGSLPSQAMPDGKAMRQSVLSLRRSTKEVLSALEAESEVTRNRLTELGVEIERERDALAEKLEPVKRSVTDIGTQIEAQKMRLDSALNEFQATSTQVVKSADAALKEVSDAGAERFEEVAADLETKTSDVMTRLLQLQSDAEEVVGAIGSTGMTGGFQKYANEQREQADKWRVVAACSLGFLVVLTTISLFFWGSEDIGSGHTVGRVLLSASLGALAAYAGNQSSAHRRREREARRFELEVAAFDPYIALLPEDRRNEVKVEMARKIFGRGGGMPITDPSVNLLDELVRRVATCSERTRDTPDA